jgi:hypothetical protein
MATASGKGARRKPGTSRRTGTKLVRRSAGAGNKQERALIDVTDVLEKLERPSAIIGGIAVIAWGFSRLTADIDCAIAAAGFESGGFEPRTKDAVAFAEQNLVLLMRHKETGVEVDASLAQLEFEGAALRAAVSRRFGRTSIRVPTVADLIIYKMVAGRPRDHTVRPPRQPCLPLPEGERAGERANQATLSP